MHGSGKRRIIPEPKSNSQFQGTLASGIVRQDSSGHATMKLSAVSSEALRLDGITDSIKVRRSSDPSTASVSRASVQYHSNVNGSPLKASRFAEPSDEPAASEVSDNGASDADSVASEASANGSANNRAPDTGSAVRELVSCHPLNTEEVQPTTFEGVSSETYSYYPDGAVVVEGFSSETFTSGSTEGVDLVASRVLDIGSAGDDETSDAGSADNGTPGVDSAGAETSGTGSADNGTPGAETSDTGSADKGASDDKLPNSQALFDKPVTNTELTGNPTSCGGCTIL